MRKKIKDFKFNRGGKIAATPLNCKILTTMSKFKRSILKQLLRIKSNDHNFPELQLRHKYTQNSDSIILITCSKQSPVFVFVFEYSKTGIEYCLFTQGTKHSELST